MIIISWRLGKFLTRELAQCLLFISTHSNSSIWTYSKSQGVSEFSLFNKQGKKPYIEHCCVKPVKTKCSVWSCKGGWAKDHVSGGAPSLHLREAVASFLIRLNRISLYVELFYLYSKPLTSAALAFIILLIPKWWDIM